jgi:hypothetical protein
MTLLPREVPWESQCRRGAVPKSTRPASSATAVVCCLRAGLLATTPRPAHPFEAPLTSLSPPRDEALAQDRVADFWAVLDFILPSEHVIERHAYH